MTNRAPFIVLEGPEGAGKSMQTTMLANWMRQHGWHVVQTREPGGTSAGDAIRNILLQSDHLHLHAHTEALLMAAARAQHVHEVIVPALDAGIVVISDRYVDSSYAYQGGGRRIPLDDLRPIQQFATAGVLPDIRLLLDLPVEEGLARRHEDAEQVNRIDRAPLEFHQRVQATFLDLARAEPDQWDIIDASRSVKEVAAAIQAAVVSRLQAFPGPVVHDPEVTGAK